MKNSEIKKDLKVIRKNKFGAQGKVVEFRTEVGVAEDDQTKDLLVKVLWDNGTLSYLTSSALRKA